MVSLRRLAVTAALALSATALPVVAATPAHADEQACLAYLEGNLVTGAEAEEACSVGAQANLEECMITLFREDVEPSIVLMACATALQEAGAITDA
ncbi:hypothetical protein [Actinokineospora pegani]|uniref:hypothetical protein n=1 Tax=Actinokineospora pegani TaxID=2654637 RepID=UPI0012EA4818|nr:hypothetical protein [Actinokineospora pegani]